ncbi:hypothetical protein AP064_05495 [Candidatus Liberibacter solanacearum]|uniref:Uncharacterized protein n=1 Tax=Candidatus Liberibacter solanacearum TaxID=556287 RepID=A0A0F4VJA9_9HYPH|nr:hypothetical protein DJ66_0320 [Candidatus Liberibacter solanacearum]KQC48689.1 hypothetical protein AP064_05495 [Candidatus Liberibacter solanacearum]
MTDGHSHCVPKCPEKQLVFVLKKLFALSRLTWHQIRNANRHKLGTETIEIKSILNKKRNITMS